MGKGKEEMKEKWEKGRKKVDYNVPNCKMKEKNRGGDTEQQGGIGIDCCSI